MKIPANESTRADKECEAFRRRFCKALKFRKRALDATQRLITSIPLRKKIVEEISGANEFTDFHYRDTMTGQLERRIEKILQDLVQDQAILAAILEAAEGARKVREVKPSSCPRSVARALKRVKDNQKGIGLN